MHEMVTLPAWELNSSLHYNTETIARDYHTYPSVWVAVGGKLPCQGNKLPYCPGQAPIPRQVPTPQF